MLDFVLTAIASILAVVDPVGAIPAYLSMTQRDDAAKRRSTAWRASLTATLALAIFATAGTALFNILGLTLAAFQIAGGLLLFLVALDMTRAERPTQEREDELREGSSKSDVAITPLAIPMLAGPASLSTVAALMGQAEAELWKRLAVYAAVAFVGALTWLTLLLASPLHRALGRTGIHVMSRVLGLILAAIAVQFVLNGLRDAGVLPALVKPAG